MAKKISGVKTSATGRAGNPLPAASQSDDSAHGVTRPTTKKIHSLARRTGEGRGEGYGGRLQRPLLDTRVVYCVNNLNQITQRDVPGTNDITGAALLYTNVTVNGVAADRKIEYFHGTVGTNNASHPAWLTSTAVGAGNSVTGHLYVAQTPEHFQYDADGNLTNDGRWAYTWDAENRLVGMTVNTNVGPQYQLTFAFDFQGRRIQKIVATNNGSAYIPVSTNNFLYDGWNLVAELGSSGTLVRNYVWGNDLSGSAQGAGGVGGLLEVSYHGTAITNAFVAYDGNGNVSALVNAADGTMLANYEYSPFGETIRSTGSLAKNNPFRFSTKYDDDESDFLYYGYRYYKSSAGTWLSRDPIEEKGGLNMYGFVKNKPIGSHDKNGLHCWCKNATVDIFVAQRDQPYDGKTLKMELGQIPNVTWNLINNDLPAGSSPGRQDFGSCYSCIYYVQLKFENGFISASEGENLWYHGNGNNWRAHVAPDRVMDEFDADKLDPGNTGVPVNWENQSGLNAWNNINGIIAAHEVLHAIGLYHSTARSDFLMTKNPTWAWLNRPIVPIDQDDFNAAHQILFHCTDDGPIIIL